MKIIKCNCSRYIHIYPADNGKCPFCNNAINIDDSIDDSFKERLSFLNDKVSKIDTLISESKYNEIFTLIDDVLEYAPNSSEIYWRKLLVSLNCKSDLELLSKVKIGQNNTAFANAVKYANENEKSVYEQIKKSEDTIVNLMEKALKDNELEDKLKTNVEKLLEEYKQKLNATEKLAQENIERLEEIEKSLREKVIDCEIVVVKYKHNLNNILSTAKEIGDTSRNDITHKEKVDWENQLNKILEESNAEFEQLKHVKKSHQIFHEYSEIVDKQKAIISEINKNIYDIYDVQTKIQNLLLSIENIAKKYTEAREYIHYGSYEYAKNLISQTSFDNIVKLAFERR